MTAPEYAPYEAAVLAARTKFMRVARSFWLIPELITSLDDVSLLFCFCRELDDAVDEAPTLEAARAALAQWQAEVDGRAPARPLVAAFLAGAPRTGLPLACVHHLLAGMEADLGPVRLPDDAAFLRYAYQVSSGVGVMLAPLLGIDAAEALWRVVDLGVGLQVSNVLLGVAADAARGRVYLPGERLRAAGLTADDVLADPADPRLGPVLEGFAAFGERYYQSAAEGVATVPIRYRHGILLLNRVYGELGRRAAHGAGAPATPLGLSRLEKLRQLGSLAVVGLRPTVLGLRPAAPHDPRLHTALAGLPGAHA